MQKTIIFYKNFVIIYISILLINSIFSRDISLSRDDANPERVAPTMLELINENFRGKSGENFRYVKNIGDYTLELKLLFLSFEPREIIIDQYTLKYRFFSYSEIFMDFIFSIKIIKNQNYVNDNGVHIIYDTKTNSSELSFQLKNIYSGIYINYIEYERQANNTYIHKTTVSPEIIIDNTTFKYPGKINKFINDNEKELELLIHESLDKYLTRVTEQYPKADGILLYETIVQYISNYNTFSVNKYTSDKKITFKEFKEEKIYVKEGVIYFSNITIKFDIKLEPYHYTTSYEKIIPYITCANNNFDFKSVDIIVQDISLKSILEYIFDLIINYYIDEY